MNDLYEKYLLIKHQMRQESPDEDDKIISNLAVLAMVNMGHRSESLSGDEMMCEVRELQEKLKKVSIQ
jgi:hypothetical protein